MKDDKTAQPYKSLTHLAILITWSLTEIIIGGFLNFTFMGSSKFCIHGTVRISGMLFSKLMGSQEPMDPFLKETVDKVCNAMLMFFRQS